jgi:serine/threonine protein kinase
MAYLGPAGTALEKFIDAGATGVVVLHDNALVCKLPRIYHDPNATPEQAELYVIAGNQSARAIEHEKKVLARLGNCPGLVGQIHLSGYGIGMEYMINGSLYKYLRSTVPSPSTIQEWVIDIADAICYAHQCHVIIGDISSKNVLLDKQLKVKLCDFEQSGLVPLTENMALAVDNGASIHTDIFQFGSLVFEMVSPERFEYDLFDNEEVERQAPSSEGYWEPCPEWPSIDALPVTKDLHFGSVVWKCWTKAYAGMAEVCKDLRKESTR